VCSVGREGRGTGWGGGGGVGLGTSRDWVILACLGIHYIYIYTIQ